MPIETRQIPLMQRIDGVELSQEFRVEVDERGEAWLTPNQVDEIEAIRAELTRTEREVAARS